MNIFEKISLGISAESTNYGLDNEEAKVNFENDYEEALLILDECDKDAVEARGAVEVMHKMVSGEAITYINEDGEEETEEISGEAGVKHAALRTAYKAKGGIAKLIQAIKSAVMRIFFRMGATDGKFKKIKTKITEYKKALEKNSKLKDTFEMKYKDYTKLAEEMYKDIGYMMDEVKKIKDGGYYSLEMVRTIIKTVLGEGKVTLPSSNQEKDIKFSKEDADKVNSDIKDAVSDKVSELNDKLKDVDDEDLEGAVAASRLMKDLGKMEGFSNKDFKFKQVYAKIEKIFNKAMKDAEKGKAYESEKVKGIPEGKSSVEMKDGVANGNPTQKLKDEEVIRVLSVAHNGLKGATTVTNKKMAILDRCLNETINQAAKVRAAVQAA